MGSSSAIASRRLAARPARQRLHGARRFRRPACRYQLSFLTRRAPAAATRARPAVLGDRGHHQAFVQRAGGSSLRPSPQRCAPSPGRASPTSASLIARPHDALRRSAGAGWRQSIRACHSVASAAASFMRPRYVAACMRTPRQVRLLRACRAWRRPARRPAPGRRSASPITIQADARAGRILQLQRRLHTPSAHRRYCWPSK